MILRNCRIRRIVATLGVIIGVTSIITIITIIIRSGNITISMISTIGSAISTNSIVTA